MRISFTSNKNGFGDIHMPVRFLMCGLQYHHASHPTPKAFRLSCRWDIHASWLGRRPACCWTSPIHLKEEEDSHWHCHHIWDACERVGANTNKKILLRIPVTSGLHLSRWMVATAHIRGGGELGHKWHCSATGRQKAVSVTDLEACMDCLVRQGYTAHGMVALEGHSAGALPMAALMNRRPASIAAAVLHAPLVDFLSAMVDEACPLRLHEAGEFGDPCADAGVLDAMLELCPYLNMKTGRLPAVLLRTGLDDVRVPSWGPAKYVAKLRDCQQGSAPALLFARPGGHFAEEHDRFGVASEDYAFLLHVMAT